MPRIWFFRSVYIVANSNSIFKNKHLQNKHLIFIKGPVYSYFWDIAN